MIDDDEEFDFLGGPDEEDLEDIVNHQGMDEPLDLGEEEFPI